MFLSHRKTDTFCEKPNNQKTPNFIEKTNDFHIKKSGINEYSKKFKKKYGR